MKQPTTRMSLVMFGILLTLSWLLGCATGHVAAADVNSDYHPIRMPGEYFNASTRAEPVPGWFSRGDRTCDLAELPVGDQVFGGIPWRIRSSGPNVIMLKGAGAPVSDTAVRGIPVGRPADVLYVLLAYNPGPALEAWQHRAAEATADGRKPPVPPTLMHLVLHYDAGAETRLNVRWGEAVQDWLRAGEYADPAFAPTVWRKQLHEKWVHDRWPRRAESVAVYALRWDNPRPERRIESLDFVSANERSHDWGAPAVLGLTVAMRDGPGEVYYVSPEGVDSNPGTFEQPWATVHHAARTLQAGDTAYVRGGRYEMPERWDALIMPKNSGTAEAPIIYAGYPGETAIIDGENHHCAHDTRVPHAIYDRDRGLFQIEEKEYVTVKNLHLQNSRKSGFGVYASRHVRLEHNVVYGAFHCGINSGRNEHLTIISNTLGQICSRLWDWDTETQQWVLPRRPVNPFKGADALPWGQWSGDWTRLRKPGREAIDNHGNQHVEIAFNEIYWCSKEGIADPSRHFKIHHNHIHHFYGRPHPTGIYLDGYGEIMDDLDVYANVVHHTASGITLGSEGGTLCENIRIHHNLCFDNWWTGILLNAAGNNGLRRAVRIENNTVYRNGHTPWERNPTGGIYLGTRSVQDVAVRNNICTDNRDYQVCLMRDHNRLEQRLAIEYNLCNPLLPPMDRTLPRLERWYPVFGDHALAADPMFVDPEGWDFRLREGSPAVDAGHPAEQYLDADDTRADLGAFAHVRELPPLPAAGEGLVLRVNCGAEESYADPDGNVWQADRRLRRGSGPDEWGATWSHVARRKPGPVAGTEMDEIYLTERYRMEQYRFPVPNGLYLVRLHFAETWHTGPGQRDFSVLLNGRPVVEHFDPFTAAGDRSFRAVVKSAAAKVYDGLLTIEFQGPGAMINGIEIIQVTPDMKHGE